MEAQKKSSKLFPSSAKGIANLYFLSHHKVWLLNAGSDVHASWGVCEDGFGEAGVGVYDVSEGRGS